MPIHFMHKSLPFDELCALYAISDACLVSSTRDGMNLVSYEYIASQGPGSLPSTPEKGRNGVMILSEFAGAAQSLNGSIVVNPWDPQQVADAIHEALTTDQETREQNHAKLFKVRSPFLLGKGVANLSATVHREVQFGVLGDELRQGVVARRPGKSRRRGWRECCPGQAPPVA